MTDGGCTNHVQGLQSDELKLANSLPILLTKTLAKVTTSTYVGHWASSTWKLIEKCLLFEEEEQVPEVLRVGL